MAISFEPAFLSEPPHTHEAVERTAILLCNLGTPTAASPAALRSFLAEFLSDRRVVEIPQFLWRLILHGVILRVRPAKSAKKYASIWTEGGSPLKVWTDRQTALVASHFDAAGHALLVRSAMRYGEPSIPRVMSELKAQGATRVLVIPLYPQYSATTTGSVIDAVCDWAKQTRRLPELRTVNRYHDDPGYIGALAKRLADHWQAHGLPDRLVMSFHGVPRRTLALGDPYHCECMKTARLVSERLNLPADFVTVTFQSRLGRAEWLQPYTEPTLIALARQGIERVDVVCPGFASDNLETLEEINMEGRAAFLEAGGKEFHHVPCLNDQPEWIEALGALAMRHLQGWPTRPEADAAALAARKARALARGATT